MLHGCQGPALGRVQRMLLVPVTPLHWVLMNCLSETKPFDQLYIHVAVWLLKSGHHKRIESMSAATRILHLILLWRSRKHARRERERERRSFSLVADCILLLMLELVRREEYQRLIPYITLIPSQYLSTCHGRINSQITRIFVH